MIRQSLDADSAYVDVALHGDGLTSLQFRDAKGAATHEVQANVAAPERLADREARQICLDVPCGQGRRTEVLRRGGADRARGAVLCRHRRVLPQQGRDREGRVLECRVEHGPSCPNDNRCSTAPWKPRSIASTDRRVVTVTPGRIEAPNWLQDGKSLIYNGGGRIYRIPAAGGKPKLIDTGFATRCNNDHGLSPDGTLLAISDQSQGKSQSLIYTLPIGGGTPKLVTPTGPSYWHGWSPDGKTLAFCGERHGEFDIYTIPADGGKETRLTTAKGLDDGPEYSPDGKSIYFNSVRTGRMQIWRMKPDGSRAGAGHLRRVQQLVPPPLSRRPPDGVPLLREGRQGPPGDKDVTLRMMALDTKKIDVLGRLFGGQGTVNVPCWSPDGKRIAFVTYQWIP